MSLRLRSKVALITGAGSGLGREACLLFAREGAKIAAVDLVPQTGEQTVRAITSNGGDAIFLKADVSSKTDVEASINQAWRKFGRLDILYNNAGVNVHKSLLDLEENDWNRVIDTNLKSVYLGSKYAARLMIQQGGGSIINTASALGTVGLPGVTAYSASKGGIIALTKALAIELAPQKIRVNCICPGATETPMLDEMFKGKSGLELAEERKAHLAGIPLSRFGQPADIANAALFLASDESSFITGSVLLVDGGFTAQ